MKSRTTRNIQIEKQTPPCFAEGRRLGASVRRQTDSREEAEEGREERFTEMTTIQLVIAVAGFVIIIVAAIITGAWTRQRAIERQMDAFRNEMRAEFAGLRGEMNARFSALEERIGRVERQLEAVFRPVLPGMGDLGDDR